MPREKAIRLTSHAAARADDFDLEWHEIVEAVTGEVTREGRSKGYALLRKGAKSYKLVCVEDEATIMVVTVTRVTKKRRKTLGSKKRRTVKSD